MSFLSIQKIDPAYHVFQAQPQLCVSSMQSLEGVAQAGMAAMQLLHLMCCISVLLCMHLQEAAMQEAVIAAT